MNKLRASTIRVNRMGQYVWNLDGYLLGKKEVDNLKPFREPFETGLQRIYISLYFPSLSTKKKKRALCDDDLVGLVVFGFFADLTCTNPKKKTQGKGLSIIFHGKRPYWDIHERAVY